eukprot:PITA_30224
MGSVTDEEYMTKLLELLRYVPYLTYEKAKVHRFVNVLPLTFRDRIEYDEPWSLEEVIGKLKLCYEQSKHKNESQQGWKEKDKGKVHISSVKGKEVEDVDALSRYPILQKFKDVFPKDIIEFPPHREVDYYIALVPRAASTSKAPYMMRTLDLVELKL